MGDSFVKKGADNPWRMMGLVGTLGLEVVAFTVIGVWLGRALDERLGTAPLWLAVCVLTGLAVGFISAVYTVKVFTDDK
jgi:ATP synthase protein I